MSGIVRCAAFAATATLAVSLSACGNPREIRLPESGASLEGTVTYGTTPVQLGLVIVTGPGGSATGSIDEATGRYTVVNAPLGEVTVAVNTEAAKGELQGKFMSGYYKGPEAKAKGIMAPPRLVDVPVKYSKPDTSTLKTTINSGVNTFNIVIPK